MNNKIEKNAKLLIINDLFFSVTSIFLETFLVAYLLKTTNENIFVVSTYYITLYTLMAFGNILIGRFIKKKSNTGKYFLSIGVCLRAIFILSIVLIGSKISNYNILIAIIYSISQIFYWCAHEIIYVDVTNENNRKKFMSLKKIFSKIINILVPIILGTSIELYSFLKIAIYILIISVLEIISVLLIKSTKLVSKKEKYSIIKFIRYIRDNKISKEKYYNLSSIAYGMVESVIGTIIIIITIMTFKTSINLGILTTIFSICSMFALLLYNKYYNKNNSKYILNICAFVLLLSVIGLLIDINKITLIIYNFCYANIFCVFEVTYNSRKGDLVEECNIEKYKEEHVGLSAFTVSLGRVIGYILMMIVALLNNIICFKLLLLVITLIAPIYCRLMNKSYEL